MLKYIFYIILTESVVLYGYAEAAFRGVLSNIGVLINISQKSQKNAYVRVSILIKLQAWSLESIGLRQQAGPWGLQFC